LWGTQVAELKALVRSERVRVGAGDLVEKRDFVDAILEVRH